MRGYRWFLLFSLCLHVLLLACTATMLLSPGPRSQNILKVTLWQPAVPLPLGEPAPGPLGAGTSAPASSSTPTVHTPPQPEPKPQKKRPHPAPSPVARKRSLVASPPPPANPAPTITVPLGLPADTTLHSAAEQTGGGGTAGGGGGGDGRGEGSGTGGTGDGGGGGGSLARPDYGVNPKPPYPLLARRMGAQGVVVLRVFVQANGTVGEVTVSQSSGFAILDESAVKTVRERWRFVPARLDGRPIASWVEVPIRFVLAGS